MKVLEKALSSSMVLQTCSLGLWLAWSFLAFNAGIWVDSAEVDSSATANVFTVSTIGFASICIFCAARPKKAARLLDNKRFVFGAGLIASIGCAAIYLSGPRYLMTAAPLAAVAVSLAGAFLTGVGTSIIAARCLQMLSLLAPRRAWYVATINILLSGAIYFVSLGTSRAFAIIVFCALPACAALMLVCNPTVEFAQTKPKQTGQMKAQPEKSTTKAGETAASSRKAACDDTKAQSAASSSPIAPKRSRPASGPCDSPFGSKLFVKFCVMAFFLTMSLSIVRAESSYLIGPAVSQSYSSITMTLRMGLALALVFGILNLSKRTAFAKIYQSVLLTMVFVPLEFSVFSVGMAFTNILLVCLYSFFEMLVFCILAHLSANSEVDAANAFGRGWGAVTLGGICGWLIGTYLPLSVRIDNIELILALLITICCVLVFVFVFTGKDLDDLVERCVPDEEFAAPAETPTPRAASFEEALAAFSEENHLSAREVDVARLVLRRTQPGEIAERLYLSINTVRRHISNIYAKTQVHSRDELIAKFLSSAGNLEERLIL